MQTKVKGKLVAVAMLIGVSLLLTSERASAACTTEELAQLRESGLPLERIAELCDIGSENNTRSPSTSGKPDVPSVCDAMTKAWNHAVGYYTECQSHQQEAYSRDMTDCQDDLDFCNRIARHSSDTPQSCRREYTQCTRRAERANQEGGETFSCWEDVRADLEGVSRDMRESGCPNIPSMPR